MTKAAEKSKVSVHFDCVTSKGIKFSSRDNNQPVEFVLGEGNMLKPFEQAMYGMEVGDKKMVNIACNDAYGEWKEENIIKANRNEMPEGVTIEKGTPLMMHTNEGNEMQVHVVDVNEEEVTLDANHPLAGHDLNFEVELVTITE
jgi:peptidylprolyl isomerase